MPAVQEQLLKLDVSADHLTAKLCVRPGVQPRPTSPEEILAFLRESKVCVNEERLPEIKAFARALSEGAIPEPLVVAEGRKPVDDKPGRIERLLSRPEPSAEQQQGKVSHYERSSIVTASAGQDIVRIIPPTHGRDGVDVFGNKLPHRRCEPVKLSLGQNVTMADDECTVRATAAGRVNIQDGKVWVDPILEIEGDVDFSTGNIHFPGEVIVHHNVLDRFKVVSEASITVHGTVEAAQIEAALDVHVAGGIVGKEKGSVRAGRNIVCRFINGAAIEAGSNVTAQAEIVHCRLVCGGQVVVENGPLLAGHTTAKGGIHCKSLGSDANVRTLVEVGIDETFRRLCATRLPDVQSRRQKAQHVREVVEPLLANQKGLTASQKEKATELLCEAAELESQADQILQDLREASEAAEAGAVKEVHVDDELHSNVIIRFPGLEAHVSQAFKGPLKVTLRTIEDRQTIAVVDMQSGTVHALETHPFADKPIDTVRRLLAETSSQG